MMQYPAAHENGLRNKEPQLEPTNILPTADVPTTVQVSTAVEDALCSSSIAITTAPHQ